MAGFEAIKSPPASASTKTEANLVYHSGKYIFHMLQYT